MLVLWVIAAALILLAVGVAIIACAVMSDRLPILTDEQVIERTAPVSAVQKIIANDNHDAARTGH